MWAMMMLCYLGQVDAFRVARLSQFHDYRVIREAKMSGFFGMRRRGCDTPDAFSRFVGDGVIRLSL